MRSKSERAVHSRLATIAVVAVAGALLAACSGGNGGSGSEHKVNSKDLVSSLPAATKQVDTLNWNLTAGEPDTLDPANVATYSSGTVERELCDSLMTVAPDFTQKPNLATGFKLVSPTQLVYTLRDDAKFWDGTPVTAEDVAYSLTRTMDPKNILSFIMINVKSVAVTGDHEVTLNLKTPDSLLPNEMQNIGIVQKAFAEKVGDKLGTSSGGVMCSGPYKLVNWEPGNSLTVTRNDDYWNKDVPRYAKTIKFSFVTDATALAQALNAGEIDGSYEVPASAVPALRKATVGKVYFGPSTQGVNFNVMRPDGPLADVQLRQALQAAIDRPSIAKIVYNGAAAPNYTALTPATWPSNEKSIYQPAWDGFAKERKYDPAAAKKLVESTTYNGTPIVLGIQAGDETSSRLAQLVQQEAAAVGLKIEIKAMQPLVYNQAGYDASKRKGIDLMLFSNFNATQDPLEPMGFVYLPGQPYNYTNYDNADVTKNLTDARASSDDKARAEMIVKAQDTAEKDSAAVPVVSSYTTTFLNNKLSGAVTSFAYWSSAALAYVGGK